MAKRVLILDTGKEWGGGTNCLIELLKGFDRGKYKFSTLFYHNYPYGSKSDIKTALEGLGVEFILLPSEPRGLVIKVLKESGRALLFFNREFRKRFIFYVDYFTRILPDSKRIETILRERKAELLYMNNQPSSNLEGILAAKALGIPCVQHSRFEVKLNPFEAICVNNVVEKVICNSEGTKNTLVKSGVAPEKCTVVYEGIDPKLRPEKSVEEVRKELGLEESSFIIGTAGSLIKRKRVHLLLEVTASLTKTTRKVVCLIVGEGPEMEKLKKQAESLGISKRVFFTGFKTDAISYINAMDIFVLPSEKEGFSLVILEAMLMGNPVVASDIVGPSELVVDGETGFLVPSTDTAKLKEAVTRLINSDTLRREMGEKSRIRAIEKFNIRNYVEGVTSIFEKVLK